jgi:hypothetical protein
LALAIVFSPSSGAGVRAESACAAAEYVANELALQGSLPPERPRSAIRRRAKQPRNFLPPIDRSRGMTKTQTAVNLSPI